MKTIVASLKFTLFHMLIFTVFRIGFYLYFSEGASHILGFEIKKAFYLGGLFDLRFTFLLLLVYFFLKLVKKIFPCVFNLKKWLILLYTAIAGFWLTMYFLDFGQYSYLKTRLDSSVLQFFKNPVISLKMMFTTYPMHWIVLGFIAVMVVYALILNKAIFSSTGKTVENKKLDLKKMVVLTVFGLCFVLGLYGKVSYYPLRWSEAFFSKNSFINYLALNPILYFFDSNRFSEKKFSVEKTKKSFSYIADYLGLDKNQPLKFSRPITGRQNSKPYNVVFIIMESLASHKTNLMNNPLKPTPYLEVLAKESYFFSKHYTPTLGTARGVFGALTGIPDVSRVKTSSRNPFVIDQRLLVDQLEGYEKLYFLGGSANWANIRAVFSNNISDVKIYEEGSYSTNNTDVWGLSDLDLFIEADKILDKLEKRKPFFAIIQSSSFHRPYTVPKSALDFTILEKEIPLQELKDSGFYSMDQLNSLRFSDFSLGHFFSLAKKSHYYKNTIFVVTGDHGLPIENAQNVNPGAKEFDLEGRHVPLIFHNHQLFPQAKTDERIVGMVDIIPTIFGLLEGQFINYTMGKNLFTSPEDNDYSFYFDNYSKLGQRKLFDKNYVLVNDDRDQPKLYNYNSSDRAKVLNQDNPDVFKKMYNLLEAYHSSSQYLLYNNKKNLK